ncbi:MAG: tRNA pseudouridine(55) synthase TruB [Clostridiales bacterium]|jgi:tRNA pseudouridine55 synthase|nr:tRNA pseudouridine(55) synthase TruB [Clostridiales bacterium]
MDNEINGVVNIYKERGYTSHDVVAVTRKILNCSKVGHTGTLDPAAEGVLPICVGKATKISEYLTSEIKAYRAVVHLGITTDTGDCTGEIKTRTPFPVEDLPISSDQAIRETVYSFMGEYLQTPPMYSAIKIGGKKLYNLARKGIEVARKERVVNIYEIQVLNIEYGTEFQGDGEDFARCAKVLIYVLCSKGTYIRALCADIGEKLGCGACMGQLVRTRSGDFCIDDSMTLNDLARAVSQNTLDSALIPIEETLGGLKRVFVYEPADKFLYNGNKISVNYLEDKGGSLNAGENVLVYDSYKTLCGIYNVSFEDDKRIIKPATMLL